MKNSLPEKLRKEGKEGKSIPGRGDSMGKDKKRIYKRNEWDIKCNQKPDTAVWACVSGAIEWS